METVIVHLDEGDALASAAGAPAPKSRCTRRGLFTNACGAAGAIAGTALFAACGTTAAHPAPRSASPVITMLPTSLYTGFPIKQQQALLDQTSAAFRQQHGGLEIRLLEPGYQTSAQASMIAGDGPDLVTDYVMTGYTAADLLLDLSPLVKRDDVNLGNFVPAQLEYYYQSAQLSPTNPQGLYGLPADINTVAYVVNLTVLDDIGQSYPLPDWTWKEWTNMWQAATTKSNGSKPGRSGGWIDWRGYDQSGNMLTPWVFHGWGGGYVDPTDSSRSFLDNAQSIACGEWAYDLILNGVCNGSPNFASGLVASFIVASGRMIAPARTFTGFKWDFFAPPIWPVRKTSHTAADFVGIWAGTKEPSRAWELVKWLTLEPDWQRMLMKVGLISPNQPSMWEEWKAAVAAAAPPLATKNLQVIVDQVQGQEPYVGNLFKNASNRDKMVLLDMATRLQQRNLTVSLGFREAAQQIGAIEAEAASQLPAQRSQRQRLQQQFPSQGPPIASVHPGM